MSKVGDTISAQEFNKKYKVGQTISAQQFQSAYGNALPKQQPAAQKESFLNKVGNLIGVTKLAQGLATVGSNAPEQAKQIGIEDLQNVQKITAAIHKQSDPARKAQLVNLLRRNYGIDYKTPTAQDINSGFGLTTKEVLGSAGQTLLTAVTAGSLPTEGAASFGISKGVPLSGALAETSAFQKLGKYASLGAKTVEGGAIGYGFDVTTKATEGKDKIFKPGLGTLIGASLPAITAGLGKLIKSTVGVTSGASQPVIDRAIKNPDEVNVAIRKYAGDDASKQNLVDQIKTGVQDYLGERNKTFGENISKVKLSEPFPKSSIVDEFENQLKKFKGQITKDGLKFSSSSLTATDKGNLEQFYNELKSWKDFTPSGVENLRQNIGNYMDQFKIAGNPRASVILGNLKKFVVEGLEERAPNYKNILSKYGQQTQLVKDTLSELNLKGQGKPSTQLNSIMRLFKKDPSVIQGLTKILGNDKSESLLNELSGAILSDWLPKGLSRQIVEGNIGLIQILGLLGHFNPLIFAAEAASTSPRIVGEASTAAGKVIQKGAGTALRRITTKLGSKLSK